MKKIILFIIALLITINPCLAINEEWSAAIGFMGGVLTAKAFDNSKYNHKIMYYQPCHSSITYVEPNRIERSYGHWEIVQEKVWIPGKWVYQSFCNNTYTKTWQSGYFQIIQKRIWIQY